MKEKLQKIYSSKVVQAIFIILPFVEFITSYMVLNVDFPITLGVIYKTLFLIYGLGYLIFVDKENRKWNFILLGLFAVTIIANIVFTLSSFSMSALMNKAVSMTKYMCLPVTLFFLYRYLKNGNEFSLKTLVYSAGIYATAILISAITGTALPTYDTAPERGISGWIYSGNELSAMMSLFYPIVIYYAAKYKSLSFMFILAVMTYGLLVIGTKTALIGLIGAILGILIFSIIAYAWKRKKIAKSTLIITLILTVAVAIAMPYSPSYKYIEGKINKIINQSKNPDGGENNQSSVENLIFNGREKYVYEQKQLAGNASPLELLIGLKDEHRVIDDTGNYTVMERDFHDVKFGYGIIGLGIYLVPIFIIAISFFIRLFKNFKEEFTVRNFCVGLSGLLGIGIAYIVGHVLLAPTVAMFLGAVFIKFNDRQNKEHEIDDESTKKSMIIYMPKLSLGGMELALINFLNLSYLKKEYDITVNIGYCTNKELLTRLPKEIYVKLICKGKWNNFSKVTTGIKYLAEYFNSWFNKYDVAICYAYQHKVLATLTRNSSKHTLLFVHTNLISSRTEEQRNALINGLKFEKFKAIVCVSDSSKAEVEKLLPNYKGKIFTVYNYIDGNKIKEMSNKEIEDKEDDKKVFINISRHLESHKRITRIINSAEKLDKEGYKNFKVWLLGDGEDHAMYRNLINEKHLENIVILKGNQVNPYKYLAKSDCLIMSSQFEGYGIVIDEARVLEKPIIATDIADARRILSEGYGIVCENSEEGIYDAMKDFLNRNYKIAQKFDYKEFNKNVDKNLKKAIDYCVQDNK